MTEQWRELKETITELRDNDGTATQQEVCKFLANYMDVLEKQMIDPIDRVLEIIDQELKNPNLFAWAYQEDLKCAIEALKNEIKGGEQE